MVILSWKRESNVLLKPERQLKSRGSGVSGVMIPPLPSAPRGRVPFIERPVDLPAFGQGGEGQSRRESRSRDRSRKADRRSRRSGDELASLS